MVFIYKILTSEQWKVLDDTGETTGAPIDVADGFVHFSTNDQVAGTLALYFAGQTNLMLAAADADSLGSDLKWEASRDGAKFPHLYAKLIRSSIVWAEPIPLGSDGKHVLPPKMLE